MAREATIVLFLTLTLFARGASAQTIEGLVREDETQRPITAAIVILVGEENNQQFAVLTDAAGNFRLNAPRPGRYELLVRVAGYADFRVQRFELTPADSLHLDIRLSPAPIELPAIVARARVNANMEGFEQRKELSYGSRLGPAELANRGNLTLSEFTARTAPWVSYRRGDGMSTRHPFAYNYRCRPYLFVDGRVFRLAEGNEVDIDRWIDPDRVQAIEVYPDPTTIPSPFFGLVRAEEMGSPKCGLIAVWTDQGLGMRDP